MRRERSVLSDEATTQWSVDRRGAPRNNPAARARTRPRLWRGLLVAASLVSVVGQCAVVRAAFEMSAPGARAAGLAFRTEAGAVLLPVPAADPGRADSPGEPAAAPAAAVATVDGAWALELSGCELFGLPEARAWRASLERRGSLVLSLEAGGLGGSLYQERVLAAGLATSGSRGQLDLGVRGLGLSAAGLEEQWSCAVDAGMSVLLLDRVLVSCGWTNLGGSSIGGSPVAQTATLCSSLTLDRIVSVVSTVVESGLEPSSSLGFEFRAARALVLRAGARMEPALFAAGMGFAAPPCVPALAGYVVDVAWQWDPELGVNTFVSISFRR